MVARRGVIEALTGVPMTRASRFAAVGLDPQGVQVLLDKVAHRKAVEKAKSEGRPGGVGRISTALADAGMALEHTGNPYIAAYAGAYGAAHDPKNDPAPLRAARLTQPTGTTSERDTQNREALNQENTPRGLETSTNLVSDLPGRRPMVTGTGEFDYKTAGVNAIASLLAALGGAAVGPGATAGSIAGGEAAKPIAERHAKNPYVRAGWEAAGSAVGGAIGGAVDPEIPETNFPGSDTLRTALHAPASFLPDLGKFGNKVAGALPNVASTSMDVLNTLAAQRRQKFRALLMGIQHNPQQSIADPFGVIPDLPSFGSPALIQ